MSAGWRIFFCCSLISGTASEFTKAGGRVRASQSSVVKFAQKLGYKGFPALKLALSESLANRDTITVHNHILSDDPLKVVGEKLLTEKISTIRATLDINSEEKLLKTLHLLKNANRILLVGIGASGLVAKDFSWKLMKIGINAGCRAGYACATRQRAGDMLLAISYTGERREINLAAQEAAAIGADVLAFTGFTPNLLQQCASICLYTVAEE